MKKEKRVEKNGVRVQHNKKLFWVIIILLALLICILIYIKYLQSKEIKEVECIANEDCVKDSCCHAQSCVAKTLAPDCSKNFCTSVCEPGTLDCGQGTCQCDKGKCSAVYK